MMIAATAWPEGLSRGLNLSDIDLSYFSLMGCAKSDRAVSPRAAQGGKYRRLILAILLFIVIDFGLLLFNFFASEQLARDSQRLSALGEMRMLTQQLTKSVLTLETEVRGELPTQTSLAQLSQGREQMNASFDFLSDSFKSDADFIYYGIDIESMRQQLARARGIWEPIDRDMSPLLEPGRSLTKEEVEFAVNRAVARNIRLSNQLDDLSAAVQSGTERKVRQMRILQLTAITRALLNFAYIVFSFIRRLRESDRQAEQARRETDDILSSVRDGLLLVYPDGRISARVSASAPELLMQPLAGRNIHDVLSSLSPELQEQARDYLKLLFDPKVKPSLLKQIDPLREVTFRPPEGGKPRYLSFSFNRILRDGQVSELLASVSDVTQKVELERSLEQTKAMASNSAEEFLRIMAHDSQLLQDFLHDARQRLGAINDGFRQLDLAKVKQAQDTFAQAGQIVHGIKGEAHGFGLESVASAAHRLEDRLQGLRAAAAPKAEELVAATTELAALDKAIAQVGELLARVLSLRQEPTAVATESTGRELEPFLQGLAGGVAERQGK